MPIRPLADDPVHSRSYYPEHPTKAETDHLRRTGLNSGAEASRLDKIDYLVSHAALFPIRVRVHELFGGDRP